MVLHEHGIHNLTILLHGILDLNYYMNISWLPCNFRIIHFIKQQIHSYKHNVIIHQRS
ncbi:hypothetical protein I3843_11G080800 [Carya illinoinensis]|nr:hypothetical protein I3843_11G080800 [Carya illinoinensis]